MECASTLSTNVKTLEKEGFDESLGVEIENEHPQSPTLHNIISNGMVACLTFFARQKGKTFIMAYQTLGMVYGGLSTTPLYLYSSLPFQALTEDDYLGLLSIIFWTLTLIGGVKYVFIVLHADDHGEGGTFALYSLLSRHMKKSIVHTQSEPGCPRRGLISWIEANTVFKKSIFCITMLATCMVIGDGILTPAISVLSAIEGLKVAAPSVNQGAILTISVALLIGLFLLQRFGTQHISFIFSPIIVAWLTTTPLIGLYNIVLHYPTIYKAISPYYMLKFFSTYGKEGWLALGGTTLCITGSEAMFADLGHFNKQSMQMGFLLAVYPSNIITYAGLSAYLIRNPQHQGQAFYKFTPTCLFWPMLLVSTLAAIVASQGLISACFSLIKQTVAMDCFPKVQIIHTSKDHEGQVYCPEVNFSLMVLCIGVVIGFHSGNALSNAYGVAVMVVMLITTTLVTLVLVVVWKVRGLVALTFLGFFGTLEVCNLLAVLSKVSKGGWLPFSLAFILALLVFIWVHGRILLTQHELSHSIMFPTFMDMLQECGIIRMHGVCFFHTLPHSPLLASPFFKPLPSISNNLGYHNHQKIIHNHHSNVSIHCLTCHVNQKLNHHNYCFHDTLNNLKHDSNTDINHLSNHLDPSNLGRDHSNDNYNHASAKDENHNQDHNKLRSETSKDHQNNIIHHDYCIPQDLTNNIQMKNQNVVGSFEDLTIDFDGINQSLECVPPLLQHYVQATHSLHKLVVFTCFHITRVPEVPEATRFFFTLLGEGLYLCTIQLGYSQPINEHCKGITWQILEHLEEFITRNVHNMSTRGLVGTNWEGDMVEVERAKQDIGHLTCHMVGIPKLKLPHNTNFLQRFAIHKLYALLQSQNTLPAILSLVPPDNLLEIHMTYEI